jgi:hypothetical protein
MRTILLGAVALLALAACSSTVQTTSGADYLRRSAAAGPAMEQFTGKPGLDQEIRAIAAIEPQLAFPARIGIARIEGGRLTPTPADELALWGDLAQALGPNAGEFVPVSPLIAAMVSPNAVPGRQQAGEVVADIRRGAARQHLDYVLVYEVAGSHRRETNALSFTDVTILGLFLVPSRDVHVEATANAVLLDVRNGYPYGTASAYAARERMASLAHTTDSANRVMPEAKIEAVRNLTGDVRDLVSELMRREAEASAGENPPPG